MLSERSLQKIARLIQCIAQGERKVEVVRQVLSENNQFETYSIFKRLDLGNKGYLTVSDLSDFFQDNNSPISQSDVANVFSIYDVSGNGRITFAEFKSQILPRENPKLVSIVNARRSQTFGRFLPYELEWALSKVLLQDAYNIRDQEALRDQAQNAYDYNLRDAFDEIDYDRLTITLTDEELEAFFRVADPSGNQKIYYLQFAENVLSSRNVRKYVGTSTRQNNFALSPKASRTFSNQRLEDTLARSGSPRARRTFYSPQLEYNNQYVYFPRTDYYLRQSQALSPLRRSRILNDIALERQTGVIVGSPMRQREEETFVRALKELIEVNRSLEGFKNQLALQPDFSLLDGFRYFDIKGNGKIYSLIVFKGFINASEFTLVLEEFGIFVTRDQVNLFFNRYDKDQDGYLSANMMKSRQPYSYNNGNFNVNTRKIMRDIFNQNLTAEVQAEAIRQRLSSMPLFRAGEAFVSLDRYDTGFIALDEFRMIFEDYGIYTDLKDLKGLVDRFDKSGQGNINFHEFVNEMSPKSPVRHV